MQPNREHQSLNLGITVLGFLNASSPTQSYLQEVDLFKNPSLNQLLRCIIFLFQGSLTLCLCLVTQLCPTLCDRIDYSLPGSSIHGNSPDKMTAVGFHISIQLGRSPGDLPNPGFEPRSPTLHVDSLPSETLRKHKNTGVGSLSLLQGNFLTQESNQGLLHCRQILYQLGYLGSSSI